MSDPALTIGDVARRTGVAVPRLRAWEARFGFPSPQRQPSGHRRYGVEDVNAIERVLRAQEGGRSLASAIAEVRGREGATPASVFGGLRDRHPELPTQVLTRRAMLGVSRAIEDECLAAGGASLLVGCFQHERFYRRSSARWRDLARTAAMAIVLAEHLPERSRSTSPALVALPSSSALLREWAVVCDGPSASAVVAGWERPAEPQGRRFEAVWSADPHVVRTAALVALALVSEHGGDRWADAGEHLPPVVDDPTAALRRATSLTNRIVSYL
jgi:DNA-binding transcriptional MerR regulator